jgi:hypothetical protein
MYSIGAGNIFVITLRDRILLASRVFIKVGFWQDLPSYGPILLMFNDQSTSNIIVKLQSDPWSGKPKRVHDIQKISSYNSIACLLFNEIVKQLPAN